MRMMGVVIEDGEVRPWGLPTPRADPSDCVGGRERVEEREARERAERARIRSM